MTTVCFFNQNPPNTKFSLDAFDSVLGKDVPVFCNGLKMGTAKILSVNIVANGVYITYETDADLGIMLELPLDLRQNG